MTNPTRGTGSMAWGLAWLTPLLLWGCLAGDDGASSGGADALSSSDQGIAEASGGPGLEDVASQSADDGEPDGVPASWDTGTEDNGSECECDAVTTCCDGCHGKAELRRCNPGDGTWGLCRTGHCEPISGSVTELKPQSIDAPVQGISLSIDGRLAAVAFDAGGDGSGGVVLWDLESGEPTWSVAGDARGVAVRPGDGELVAVGGSPASLRTTEDGSVSLTLPGTSGPVAFSPDGTLVATSDGGEVVLFDAATGERKTPLHHALDAKSIRWSIAFSPDGTRLASATGQSGLGSPSGEVRLFDLVGDGSPRSLTCPSMGAAFSPDGTRLAAACWHSVIVWDAATGDVVGWRYDGDSVLSVAWSPDGRILATGTLGSGIKFLDADNVATGVGPLAVFPLLQARAIAFDPLGRRLLAASWLGPTLYSWTWEAPWPAWLEGGTP